jgi:hypothetical protein
MTWQVMSSRLVWPAGTVLTVKELAGCNIKSLVEGGHLSPVTDRKRTSVRDTAEEPKEQD